MCYFEAPDVGISKTNVVKAYLARDSSYSQSGKTVRAPLLT